MNGKSLFRGYMFFNRLGLAQLSVEVFLYGRMKGDDYLFIAVELFHGNAFRKIFPDDVVDKRQSAFYRLFIDGIACQLLYFFIGKVVNKIRLGTGGLDGHGLGFCIYGYTMTV